MATKAKDTPSTQVATQQPAGIVFTEQAPDWVDTNQRRGSENVGIKDTMLPRLELVQAQSPIKDLPENEGKQIEGMLFNTLTNEVIGDAAYIVPVFYRMEWLVWKDVDSGGGFFGAFSDEMAANRRKQEVVAGGEQADLIEVIDTPVHYCMRIKPDGTTEQIVISMAKSKSKVSRKWNATIDLCGGDRFSRVYKFGSFKDENRQGKKFFNYNVQPIGFVPKNIFDEALRLYEVFKAGTQSVDFVAGTVAEGVSENHTPI